MTLAWLYRINQRYGSSGVVPLLSGKRKSKSYCIDNEPDEQLHFLNALYSRTSSSCCSAEKDIIHEEAMFSSCVGATFYGWMRKRSIQQHEQQHEQQQ